MEYSNIFSLTRLGNLIRRQYTLNIRTLITGFAAISGVIAMIGFLTAIEEPGIDQEAFVVLYYVALFIGGFFLTSRIFSEMQSQETAIHYMTLPVSNLEKLITGWLYSSIFFLIISLVFIYITYYIAAIFALMILGTNLIPLNIFEWDFLLLTAIYLVLQPIFMLGAATFKRHNFLKTLLSLFVLALIIVTFSAIYGRILLGNGFDGSINIDEGDLYMSNFFENYFVPVVKVLFWYIMAPFLMIVSYFTLKEREV